MTGGRNRYDSYLGELNKARTILVVIFALIILTVIAVSLARASNLRNNDQAKNQDATYLPVVSGPAALSCRLGVTSLGSSQLRFVDKLGAGWYVLFGGVAKTPMREPEMVPIIHVKQDKDGHGNYLDTFKVNPSLTEAGLGAAVSAFPGTLWIVGNEVDRTAQGETYPEIYARAYHQIYHFIKTRDPSAQVAISGLVEVTPGRLQYLDMVWDAYLTEYNEPMPVDVWNMHVYILPEAELDGAPNNIANIALGTNPALAIRGPGTNPGQCAATDIYCYAEHDDIQIFADQIRAMRRWMADHGQRMKPLILSEFSLLYPFIDDGSSCYLQDEFGNCFTPSRVVDFLRKSIEYLETATDAEIGFPLDRGRLVQQMAWFSINNSPGVGDISDLFAKENGTGILSDLTPVGVAFNNEIVSRPKYSNLMPEDPEPLIGYTNQPTGTADIAVEINIWNNGNLPVTQPFTVTLYADENLTQPMGSINVDPLQSSQGELKGCARLPISVLINWSGLVVGQHSYWVVVDSQHQVREFVPDGSGETDNVVSGVVTIELLGE